MNMTKYMTMHKNERTNKLRLHMNTSVMNQ